MKKLTLVLFLVVVAILGGALQDKLKTTTLHFNTLTFIDNETQEVVERRVGNIDFMVVNDEFRHIRLIDNDKKEDNINIYWIIGPPEKEEFKNGSTSMVYTAFSEKDDIPCIIVIPESEKYVILYVEAETIVIENLKVSEEIIQDRKIN